ncbi:phage tail tube protein [Bacillus sp. RG28]|uniref:Phage tail tube protein n=1 Tax=Gottfriedia endophytica TaxID=2820819 RepID=A0A940NPU7_9BACI|nr:phage tail tube protein [Gottfriedia endophytica]MBP0725535.1 phage tail tube protein [Gottfriedia endophytica]
MEKMIADKAISGTFGEVWIDGEKFAEATGLQAKIDILKEDVPICGAKNGKGKKQMGWEGKGSIELTKVNSRLLKKQVEALQSGKSLVVTIVSKLADPASNGAERIALKNVTFDDISLADWSANKIITEQKPFTFDDFELLDLIS